MNDILDTLEPSFQPGEWYGEYCITANHYPESEVLKAIDLAIADYRAKLLGESVEPVGEIINGTAKFYRLEDRALSGKPVYFAEQLAARVAQAQAETREQLLSIVYSYAANLAWNDDFQDAIRARGGKEQSNG